MNAPLLTQDDLADAREETHRLLQSAMHYCKLTQGHLAIADDAGAIWDFHHADEYFKGAVRQFEIVRAAFSQRVIKPEQGA